MTDERASGVAECSRLKILVIDDEELILLMLERMLRKHEVTPVGGAAEALDRLVAKRETFDVILCDLHMPMMGGEAFWRALLAARPEMADRIVFTAGGSSSPKDDAFFEAHPTLMKPFRLKDFEAEVIRLGLFRGSAAPGTAPAATGGG